MNIKRLDGALLNYWIARSAGLQLASTEPRPGASHDPDNGLWHPMTYCPSSDWSLAGPIISNEWFSIEDQLITWFGTEWTHINAIVENPLKWFMRAYVATQFGDEVEDLSDASPLPLQHLASGASPQTQSKAVSRLSQWLTHMNR